MTKTYTCSGCLETYEYGWTDEEAVAERLRALPDEPFDASEPLLCDDCYKKLMAQFN